MSTEMDMNEEESKLRKQLQRAVRGTEVPPYLESKIRASIRASETRQPFRFGYSWMAATAAVALAVFGGIAYQLGHLRLTIGSQESYIASVSNHVASIMRVGLRDHLHCSHFRKFPKDEPKLENIEQKLPAPYRGMIPIVRKHVPAGFQLMITHECGYQGRKFVHLALKRRSQLLSVVLAVKQDGESFKTEELIPALTEAGIPFYRSGAQQFQIAAFESDRHLIYIVSDVSQAENMRTMTAMAPELRTYLNKLAL
ncbi:MAG: hypothetical protein IT164_11470 [Bryobacterales bacterium]|nr:hypothetical protein [Bryobacterales bacterium]